MELTIKRLMVLSVRQCWKTESISVNHLHASSLAWVTGKNQLKRHKMDDLLLRAAKLADTKLTVGSSDDDDIEKILFEASCQFDPVPPSTAKRPKTDSKESDGFAIISTYIARFSKCVRMPFQ